jgi:LysM repeat protein
MRRIVIVTGSLLLSLLLAACFRDAGDGQNNPTSVPLNEFLGDSAVTPTRQIPTLTATPERSPTKTLSPGGPPVASETPENDGEESDDGDTQLTIPTLPPTVAIPSFTPTAVGSRFGDSGITPTVAFPTQPIPNGLITPTAFDEEVGACIYVVQANDTLFSIATANGVTVDEFVAVNPDLAFNPNALSIGQYLAIPNCQAEGEPTASSPTSAATIDPAATAVPTGSRETYIVQDGDTLFGIAGQFGTTVDAIIALNPELSVNNIIYPGQELIIPPASQ